MSDPICQVLCIPPLFQLASTRLVRGTSTSLICVLTENFTLNGLRLAWKVVDIIADADKVASVGKNKSDRGLSLRL